MTLPTAPNHDHAPPPEAAAPSPRAPLALVREVQGPSNDRGRAAGLAMVCSAAGVALGFALAGSLFAAMAPPPRAAIGPAGWSACPRGSNGRVALGHRQTEARPWLGVRFDTRRLGGPAIIAAVIEGTPADRAGLRVGDRVLRFDGRDVGNPTQLIGMVRAHRPGDAVSLDAVGLGGRQISIQNLVLATLPVTAR